MKNITGYRIYYYPCKKVMLMRRMDELFFYHIIDSKINSYPYSTATLSEYLSELEKKSYAYENDMSETEYKQLVTFLS